MVSQVNGIPFRVLVLVYHWLIVSRYVSSTDTRIRLVPRYGSARNVVITCESATDVGEILALFLERSPLGEEKYEKQFTVDSGMPILWNESSRQGFRSRSDGTGEVTAAGGSLRLKIRRLNCQDSATFRCVTAGRLASSTSVPKDLQVVGIPQTVYISQVAALGSKYSQTLQPSSRVFYRRGEGVELACSARLGEPVSWNTFHWYKMTPNDTKTHIVSKKATRYVNESSAASCKFSRGFSNIKYQPPADEIETAIFCEVQFRDPTFRNFSKNQSSSITLYVYGERGNSVTTVNTVATDGYSRKILVAAILGSIAGVLVICALVLLILRAYGYRCAGPMKEDNKTVSMSSEHHMEYITANHGGHPAHISMTSDGIYDAIDLPIYRSSNRPNTRVDSHGYLDLNNA